jgi:post-segregation antitoxin (ccd killing protein)
MKIKIRPRLDTKLVVEARALGLDISRIVEEALVRDIEAERLRFKAERGGVREGGAGSSTAET